MAQAKTKPSSSFKVAKNGDITIHLTKKGLAGHGGLRLYADKIRRVVEAE